MFAHITLAVRNARRSAEFFERTMHWRQVDMPGNIDLDAAWIEVAPGQQIHILTVPGFEPSPFEKEYGRHFAFLHAGEDFTALKQRLSEAGATLVEAQRPTPFERFFFIDLDGYYFEIIDRERFESGK